MNKSTLDQANSIISAIKALDDLKFVISRPYPNFSCNDKNINSASFDNETLERLKVNIRDFIDKRQIELEEKFELL